MSTSRRVVAPSMPWRQGADPSWRDGPGAGASLNRVLEELGEPPTLLIGHSFGAGAVIEALCSPTPPPVSAAAVIAPPYRMERRAPSWDLFKTAWSAYERQVERSLRARLQAPLPAEREDRFGDLVRRILDQQGPSWFLAAFDQMVASARWPLERVAPPVLVLVGHQDPGLFPDQLDALVTRLPDVELIVDPEVGHVPQVTHPHRLAAAIDGFAARRAATAREQETS